MCVRACACMCVCMHVCVCVRLSAYVPIDPCMRLLLLSHCLQVCVCDPNPVCVAFSAGAYQVKWNRVTNNLFATTHEGDIRIWDPRVSECVCVCVWVLFVCVRLCVCMWNVVIHWKTFCVHENKFKFENIFSEYVCTVFMHTLIREFKLLGFGIFCCVRPNGTDHFYKLRSFMMLNKEYAVVVRVSDFCLVVKL